MRYSSCRRERLAGYLPENSLSLFVLATFPAKDKLAIWFNLTAGAEKIEEFGGGESCKVRLEKGDEDTPQFYPHSTHIPGS